MLEAQIRDQQRRKTTEWAAPRQNRDMYNRWSNYYGGGTGTNDTMTIENLNI